MTDIATLLREQTLDEPAYDVDVDSIVSRGRGARRRRTAATAAAGAAVLAAVVAVPLVTAGSSGEPAGPDTVVPAASEPATPEAQPTVPHGPVTKDNIAAIVAAELGVRLVDPQLVRDDRPLGKRPLDFVGNADNGDGRGATYLFVSYDGAGQFTTPPVSCAEINSGMDGYTGPCELRVLADGSTLVQRSGRTDTGGYEITHAYVVRPDGSGFTAQSSNQPYLGEPPQPPATPMSPPPAIRDHPPVTAQALADLVLELHRRGRG